MTLQDRIAVNAEKGYIYVGTVDGNDVWKKFDGNATVYYLDEGYEEVIPIWNTLRSTHLLTLIFKDQHN